MESLAAIVWNQEESRLRAFVRICLYLALWRATSLLLDWLLIPPLVAFYHRIATAPAPWFGRALHFVLHLLAVVLATWIAVRWLDRRAPGRRFADLGLTPTQGAVLEMAIGLLMGLLLMTLVFLAQWLAGWVTVVRYFSVHIPEIPFAVAILGPILAFTVIGIAEEVIFRGYVLRNGAEGLRGVVGSPQASLIAMWAISSLLFGLFHVFNPNSSWFSTLNLVLAGVMLGLPVVLTGRLALAIGLHMTWNFAQGTIYGFPVSGNEFGSVALLVTRATGPTAVTGGQFGPEAGLVGLLAIVLGCLMILAWVRLYEGQIRLHEEWTVYRHE